MASVPQGSGSGGAAGSGTPTTSTVTSTTSDVTASDGEVVLADASGGAMTVTLPGPASGDSVVVKKTDSSGNAVTIARPGGENIDGDASDRTLTGEDQSRHIVSDGSDYFII